MSLEHWFALLSICLLGAMSPGPSLAVVLSSTLGLGRSAGFQTAWAHGAGVALYGLLTVTGLALIVTSSPGIFLALQVAGALYLIYLGTKSLRQALGSAALEQDPITVGNPATAGFLVAFLNPKLAVFMLALFSQFLDPTFGFKEKSIMVATIGITDALWYSLVALLVSQARFRRQVQQSARIVDAILGVILIALALTVLFTALMGMQPSGTPSLNI